MTQDEATIHNLERKVEQLEKKFKVLQPLKDRNAQIELLEKYSKFLEEHGYMDTDWQAEEPFAIDEFLGLNL